MHSPTISIPKEPARFARYVLLRDVLFEIGFEWVMDFDPGLGPMADGPVLVHCRGVLIIVCSLKRQF